MLVTRLTDIIETATGVKIPPSGEISFALIISLAILLMKRFKAIYNYIIRLVRKIMKVGIV